MKLSTVWGGPMQSVPAWMYEAMTIGAFGIGIVVFVMGIVVVLGTTWIVRDFASSFPKFAAAIGLCAGAPIILGGGLIWLGLHYGFEYHERLTALVSQPVPNTPPVASREVPKQSSACNTVEARYGLIIDAGSSGSRIYIYCWRPGEANRVPWVTPALGQDGKPLLFKVPKPHSDVSCESDADNCLAPLIDYALKKIGNGSQILEQTRVHLMATAGMRLKQRDNPEQSKVTMETVDAYLKKTFKSASTVTSAVITAEEEALYGWIAVNYLMGFLKADKEGNLSPTMGILELGGASTQIAYASDPSQQGLFTLPWGKTTYQIYRQSFVDLGQDRALDKIDAFYRTNNSSMIKERKPINPCYPKDYKPEDYDVGEGTGNYNECKDQIEKTLLLLNNQQTNNRRQPPHGVFLAHAGYSYTYLFFTKAFDFKPFFFAFGVRSGWTALL